MTQQQTVKHGEPCIYWEGKAIKLLCFTECQKYGHCVKE